MAIHPIDYRYGTPEMRAVWSEENRFRAIVTAEVALARAEAAHGMIPREDAETIAASAHDARLERVKEIELMMEELHKLAGSGELDEPGEAEKYGV